MDLVWHWFLLSIGELSDRALVETALEAGDGGVTRGEGSAVTPAISGSKESVEGQPHKGTDRQPTEPKGSVERRIHWHER